MRTKCITTNCATCPKMDVSEVNQMVCTWGKSKPKYLKPQKGKKPLQCRLKGRE